jgi:hypothetical protein
MIWHVAELSQHGRIATGKAVKPSYPFGGLVLGLADQFKITL